MSAFEQIKGDLDRMNDSDYKSYVGLVAIQKVGEDILRTHQQQREIVDYMSELKDMERSDSFLDEGMDISERSITSFVEQLRESVFRVRLVDAFKDLIRPLQVELEKMQIEDHLFHLKNHNDDLFYKRQTIYAIDSLSARLHNIFSRTMVMEWKRFTRNPVWTTLRLVTTKVIFPILNVAGSILTGWKKKSDTDRIVEAIDKLTELTRTGQINQDKSLFQRFASGGLIGTLGKSIVDGFLSDAGITKERAQQVENDRSTGTIREYGILDKISSNIFQGEVTKKKQGTESIIPNTMLELHTRTNELLDEHLVAINDSVTNVFQQSKNLFDLNKDELLDVNSGILHTVRLIDDSVNAQLKQSMNSADNIIKTLSKLHSIPSSSNMYGNPRQGTKRTADGRMLFDTSLIDTQDEITGSNVVTLTEEQLGIDVSNVKNPFMAHKNALKRQQRAADEIAGVTSIAANEETFKAIPEGHDIAAHMRKKEEADRHKETIDLGSHSILMFAEAIDLLKEQNESLESVNYHTKVSADEAKRTRRQRFMQMLKASPLGAIFGSLGAMTGVGGGLLVKLKSLSGILGAMVTRFGAIGGAIGAIQGVWRGFRSFEEGDDAVMKTLKLIRSGSGGFIEGVANATVGLLTKVVDFGADKLFGVQLNSNEVYGRVVEATKHFFDDPIANLITGMNKLDAAMYSGFDWVVDNTVGAAGRMFRVKVEEFKSMVHRMLPERVANRLVGTQNVEQREITPAQREVGSLFVRRQEQDNQPSPMMSDNFSPSSNPMLEFIRDRNEVTEMKLNIVADMLNENRLSAEEIAGEEIALLSSIREYIKQVATRRPEREAVPVFAGGNDDINLLRGIGS